MSKTEKPEQTKLNRKNRKFTTYATILAALALAIAIPVNLVASRLDVKWDMTPAGLYELSSTTQKYLDNLEEEGITVDFYFLMDMDYLATDEELLALYYTLEAYSEYDCINFVDFDPDEDPDLLEEANPDGYFSLSTGDMIIQYNGYLKRVQASSMYEYEYSYDDDGNAIVDAAYFKGENYISGAISAVVEGRDTKVYFLTGHGEKSLSDDYTTFYSNLVTYNYSASTLNLNSVEAVPDDANVIVIAGPETDISKAERDMLMDYLEGGGNIIFLISPNDDESFDYTNLEYIMNDYGIAMDYDIVYETSSSLYVGDNYMYQVELVEADSDSEYDLTSELIEMVDGGYYAFMSNSRSFLTLVGVDDSTLEVYPLIQTSASEDADGNAIYTAIGKAYGGTDPTNEDITGEVLDLAMYSVSPARNDSKIIVFGSADFIDDESLTEDYMIIPVYLLLSTITWMYDSDLDMDMGIADKEKDYDSMTFDSESTANTVVMLFLAFPFVVGLVGTAVWVGRRYA